jgi:hypothetical protein
MDYCTRPRLAVRMALNDRQLDRAFRALTDATRRWVIEVLLDHDATVLQLAEPHPLSLPTLLEHSIQPDALYPAERWLRTVMWARYGMRLGSLPEDYPRLRAMVSTR